MNCGGIILTMNKFYRKPKPETMKANREIAKEQLVKVRRQIKRIQERNRSLEEQVTTLEEQLKVLEETKTSKKKKGKK